MLTHTHDVCIYELIYTGVQYKLYTVSGVQQKLSQQLYSS